jgi:hypothetical protein
MQKKCNTCNLLLDLSLFSKKKEGKYGRKQRCKKCSNLRRAERLNTTPLFLVNQKKEELKKQGLKECTKCKLILELDNFTKNVKSPDGLYPSCKICKGKQYKEYTSIEDNRLRKNKKARDYSKERKTQDSYKEWQKDYKSRPSTIEKRNKRIAERKANDPLFKLRNSIPKMISKVFKRSGYSKNTKTQEILGCDWITFKNHIESQFEDWMTWENKSKRSSGEFFPKVEWDIDHIIPLSSAKNEDEVIKLNHYTNLRPFCSYENRWIKRNIFNN